MVDLSSYRAKGLIIESVTASLPSGSQLQSHLILSLMQSLTLSDSNSVICDIQTIFFNFILKPEMTGVNDQSVSH